MAQISYWYIPNKQVGRENITEPKYSFFSNKITKAPLKLDGLYFYRENGRFFEYFTSWEFRERREFSGLSRELVAIEHPSVHIKTRNGSAYSPGGFLPRQLSAEALQSRAAPYMAYKEKTTQVVRNYLRETGATVTTRGDFTLSSDPQGFYVPGNPLLPGAQYRYFFYRKQEGGYVDSGGEDFFELFTKTPVFATNIPKDHYHYKDQCHYVLPYTIEHTDILIEGGVCSLNWPTFNKIVTPYLADGNSVKLMQAHIGEAKARWAAKHPYSEFDSEFVYENPKQSDILTDWIKKS